jgi:hypothetical protein
LAANNKSPLLADRANQSVAMGISVASGHGKLNRIHSFRGRDTRKRLCSNDNFREDGELEKISMKTEMQVGM